MNEDCLLKPCVFKMWHEDYYPIFDFACEDCPCKVCLFAMKCFVSDANACVFRQKLRKDVRIYLEKNHQEEWYYIVEINDLDLENLWGE